MLLDNLSHFKCLVLFGVELFVQEELSTLQTISVEKLKVFFKGQDTKHTTVEWAVWLLTMGHKAQVLTV